VASPLLGSLASTINKSFKGLFLDATITRDSLPTGPAYDPVAGPSLSYACKAIAAEYATNVQGMNLVAGQDISVIILAKSLPAGFEPQSLDRVAIPSQNIAGTIVAETTTGLKAVMGDPARATWTCRVIV
jgi:hypothetical protein